MSLVSANMNSLKPEFAFELSALNAPSLSSTLSSIRSSSETPDADMGSDDDESGSTVGTGIWTKEEHARFLEAIKIYANGPWKLVAAYVATRTVRQTMTHAQKYRQKAARRLRGLRTKQALMRMHYGHRISEESLVQERLRSLAAQVEDASSSSQPLYTPTSAVARRAASSLRNKQRASAAVASAKSGESLLALLTDKKPVKSRRAPRTPTITTIPTEPFAGSSTFLTNPAVSPAVTATATSNNTFDMSSELEIIDDLSEAPSLEECAEMLYDLLCC